MLLLPGPFCAVPYYCDIRGLNENLPGFILIWAQLGVKCGVKCGPICAVPNYCDMKVPNRNMHRFIFILTQLGVK